MTSRWIVEAQTTVVVVFPSKLWLEFQQTQNLFLLAFTNTIPSII